MYKNISDYFPCLEISSQIWYNMSTVQQFCAFTAQNVRKSGYNRQRTIAVGNFAWFFACNYEATEELDNMLKFILFNRYL